MFEDEHLLEGGRCGSASHCETLSIAVASLCHQIILSQPPIAFTCSISLCAVFPLRTSPTVYPTDSNVLSVDPPQPLLLKGVVLTAAEYFIMVERQYPNKV